MLNEPLQQALERENVSLNEFKELVIRLLNYGVLCRNESLVEQQIYDRYLRLHSQVADYFELMDVRLLHEPKFEYVRLYPPGSQVPGMEEAEASAFGGSLRSRLNQHEVAMVLVLRLQYDKALREGKVDENGYVTESLESLGIAIKNLLGRSLPEKMTERTQLFKRLRQLRLINCRQDELFDSGEAWIKIHPMIVNFVSDECLQALSGEGDSELVAEADDEEELQSSTV